MKVQSVLLVGAGGIGTHIAEPMLRLLAHHPEGTTVLRIVDGDVYEERNAQRQMFPMEDVGSPKSAVLGRRLVRALGGRGVYVDTEHGYVNSAADAAALMIRTQRSAGPGVPVVVLAVDNDSTRRLFYDALREEVRMDHPITCVIDLGNGLDTATCVTSFWHQRKPMLMDPVECYENLKNPADRVPGGGCAERAPSTPQLMVANMAAALSGTLVLQALLDGVNWNDVVCSDTKRFVMTASGGDYAAPFSVKKEG